MTQVEKINIKIIQSHTFKKKNVWRRITKSKRKEQSYIPSTY